MRCDACNAILTEKEDSRKSEVTNERIGLCDPCFRPIQHEVKTTENPLAEDNAPVREGSLVEELSSTSESEEETPAIRSIEATDEEASQLEVYDEPAIH